MIELEHPNSADYRDTVSNFYSDTYTFSSVHVRTDINPHGYCFHEKAMSKGRSNLAEDFPNNPARVLSIFYGTSNKVLNLVSNNRKLLVEVDSNWFHFSYEQLPSIIYQLQQDPHVQVIIKTPMAPKTNTLDSSTLILIKMLSDLKVDYHVIDHHEHGVWEINNFMICKYGATAFLVNNFYEFCKRYVVNKDAVPFRKIFISRKFIKYDENLKNSKLGVEDSRIDDHDGLENFFRDLGFEILYPENIPNFEERVNLFYETDVLAALTGAGIANAVFMQEGATMLEIATPLVRSVAISNEWAILQEFHNSYNLLAFRKKLIYLSIPNMSRSIDETRKILDKSRIIKKIFENRKIV